MNMFTPLAQSAGDYFFYHYVLDYLHSEIRELGIGIMHNAMKWVGGASLVLMTIWVVVQGWRIVTGQTRESMMLFVTNSLRATIIVAAATSMSFVGYDLHRFLTETVRDEINLVVTGETGGPEKQIDENLRNMQLALSGIDALNVMGDQTLNDEKTRALWFTGFGAGGPALIGGALLLLYDVALSLFIGFGPLFILSLLFEQTKPLFGRWLYYGIGTLFSMAVLSAMVSIAAKMVTKVTVALWLSTAIGAFLTGDVDSITSQSMQQGGLGVILTVLIVSAPPMAAAFFQGAMGYFSPGSALGGGANVGVDGAGRMPGQAGYMPAYERPAMPANAPLTQQTVQYASAPRLSAGQAPMSSGRLGNANAGGEL